MSRWTDQYETHQFRISWAGAKTALEAINLDEASTGQVVSEVARLNKITAYIDESLGSVDPEFVPLSKWDELNSHAASFVTNVTNFNSDENIAHLQNANANADAILHLVKPYVLASGKASRVLNSAAIAYAKTLEGTFQDTKQKIASLLGEVEAARDSANESRKWADEASKKVVEARVEVVGDEDEDEGISGEIRDALTDIKESHQSITQFYNELLIGDEENDSKKSKLESATKEIEESSETIVRMVKRTDSTIKDLEKFHEKVFGVLDSEGGRSGGYSAELVVQQKRLADFESQQQTRYKALNDQIESLLPGATSAGPASAYGEMKKSFDDPIKFFSIVFFVSIAVLVVGSIVLAIQSVSFSSGITFFKVNGWEQVLESFAYKLPFYGPAVWLAYYASNRRSENQRLQQEYAHKEALAKSYDSYKKQISELNSEDSSMLVMLLTKAIEAISHNASSSLDGKHGDKMPLHDALDRILKIAQNPKAPAD